MNRKYLIFIFIILYTRISSTQSIKMSYPGRPTSIENFISEVAAKSESSGSLVVRGSCTYDNAVVAMLKLPPEGPFLGVEAALNALVHTDTNLTWHMESDRNFRVRDRRVSDDILGTRIRNFQIKNALGGNEAISQLMNAPEIKAAFLKNSIEAGLVVNHLAGAAPGLPRYSSTMHDTTLNEALDQIIAFYPGVWIYSECISGSTRRVMLRTLPVRWPASGQTSHP